MKVWEVHKRTGREIANLYWIYRNYAGNNFAISTADVGSALQNSAAALQTNGVSMEQSVAMV